MLRRRILFLLTFCTALRPAAALDAEVNVRVVPTGPAPTIVSTLPVDGSAVTTTRPTFRFVFSTDMHTGCTDVTRVFLPRGLTVSQLVWSDARTLDIFYNGSIDPVGAKRVALADNYFMTPGNRAVPRGSGLAFYYPPNSPPMIVAGPTATPAEPKEKEEVSFTVTAADADGDALTYDWDFGDGATASGQTVVHTYAAVAAFLAVVTVRDGKGGEAQGSVLVGTKGGGGGAGLLPWTVTKAKILRKLGGTGTDKVKVYGKLDMPAGWHPKGKRIVINVGGVTAATMLDYRGRSRTGSYVLVVKRRTKWIPFGGNVTVGFVARGSFATTLANLGMTDATTAKEGVRLPLNVLLSLDGSSWSSDVTVTWKAKAGKSGLAKLVKR